MTELITATAEAGAVISACWAIVSGIGAWKREFIGKRKIELAEAVLSKFFEVKDAVAFIRNPFSTSEEGKSRQRSVGESAADVECQTEGMWSSNAIRSARLCSQSSVPSSSGSWPNLVQRRSRSSPMRSGH